MAHLEIELKSLLTHAHFHQLMQYFGLECQQPIVQCNVYYDTPTQQLKQHHASLRLRQFTHTSEWTIKQRVSRTHSLELTQHNDIRHDDVPTSLDTTFLNEDTLISFFEQANIELGQLHPTVSFTTKRWEIPLEYGTYCLDCSTFGDTTDYEIELETHDLTEAQTKFDQLLAQLNIPYTPAPKKIARAFKYYA